MKNIDGLLIDISGTLIIDGVIPFQNIEWLSDLIKNEIPFLLVTNTTISSRQEVVDQINQFGLNIKKDLILNPETAAYNYIKKAHPLSSVRILINQTEHNWNVFNLKSDNPDLIVLGDLQQQFDYTLLNEIFNQLMSGSKLIALHKSKFWSDIGRLKIDLGGYISLLEYASGKESVVIGKPSVQYYETACQLLKIEPEKALMVGDDLYSDALAAQNANLKSVLVKTGKYLEKFQQIANKNNISVVDKLSDIKVDNYLNGVKDE